MKLKNKIVALFLTVACAFGLAVAGNAQKVDAANFGVTIENADVVATFDFGANGTASHYDGSEASSKSYTSDGYTLAITGATKVYFGARDAKGNSALKLGTGKLIGSFSFTVADDVNYVAIHAAQYKANASKLSVNGATYSLASASNNGAYDVIAVDTSTTKTIKVATVASNYRCMINTIEFYKAAGTIVEKTDAEKVAIAKENLKLDATTVVTNITLPTAGDYDTEITWESSDDGILDFEGYVERPAEDTVITLTATITLGDVVETKEFQVTVKGFDRTIVKAPVAGKYYKLVVTQENVAKDLYFKGTFSGNFYATTEDAAEAAYVVLEETEGGFYYKSVSTEKYINLNASTAYLELGATPVTVWTFNTTYNTLTAKVGSDTYYLGTFGTYTTISKSTISYAATSFVSHLVELTEAELEELNALKVKVGYQVGTKDEAKALRLVAEFNLTSEDLETFESTIAFRVTRNGVADERVVTTLYSSVNPMNDEAELTGAYYAVLTYVNVPAGEYTVEVLVDGEVAATVVATVA